MTEPEPVALADGVGVVVPAALIERTFAALAREAERRQRVDGVVLLDDERALLGALRDASAANAVGSARGTEFRQIKGDNSGWLTCVDTARVVGCSARWARKLARTGEFSGAHRFGRDWRIPAAAVDLYRARHAKGAA